MLKKNTTIIQIFRKRKVKCVLQCNLIRNICFQSGLILLNTYDFVFKYDISKVYRFNIFFNLVYFYLPRSQTLVFSVEKSFKKTICLWRKMDDIRKWHSMIWRKNGSNKANRPPANTAANKIGYAFRVNSNLFLHVCFQFR